MSHGDHHAFWADDIADEIEARDPSQPIVIKGAVSPSGVPHVGHANEIILGYFVACVLRERGHEVQQVFVADDRDGLRKIPRSLADVDWNVVDLGDVDAGALGRNLGVPYSDVPDPFGDCHASYGDHFTALLAESAEMVDVPLEVRSTTDCYETGRFDDVVLEVLEKRERARAVIAEHQDGVSEDYVPFMAQCANCGRLTTKITDVDVEGGTVEYECTGMEAGGQRIEGCGHVGTATFREGKLPWRFEWPAGWKVFGVDFEPFGKDHAEGSWPSGQRIAREILEIDPPVPMTYEWFTVNEEALSSSAGNVVTVPELLALIEPAVLRYFFAKNPHKQRDLNLDRIHQLVDDFDRFEAVYFGEVDADERERQFAERVYPFVVQNGREERVRLPYTFAAVLGMTDDRDLRLEMARREGHVDENTPEWAIDVAMDRVDRARRWAERTDNEYNYRIQVDLPDTAFDEDVVAALAVLADLVSETDDGEVLQGQIYEVAERHGVETGDLFAAGYELFLGRPRGPRLGPFLAALDEDFVVRRLRLQE